MKTYSKKRKGFSLVEMLVAMFVTVVIMIAVVSVFASVVKTRAKIKQYQQDLENGRAALEYMSKTLRMGIDVRMWNNTIYFFNSSQGNCMSFRNNSNTLQVGEKSAVSTDMSQPCGLNDSDVASGFSYVDYSSAILDSNGLLFSLVPNPSADDRNGKVTILLKIHGKSLQTSVSFRDYGD